MNFTIALKIISITLSCFFLAVLALKKRGLSGFFEKSAILGLSVFAFFIPLNDGIAVFGMVAAIIFFIAMKISARDASIPRTPFNRPIMVYAGIAALSFLWTYSFRDSLNEGGEIIYFTLFFFAAAGLLTTKRRIWLMVSVFTVSITIAIFIGFFQGISINALHGHARLTGPIGNWTSFPVQVSFGIVTIMAFFLLDFGNGIEKIKSYFLNIPAAVSSFFLLLVIFAGLMDTVFSKARSAWIGIVPAAFVLIYLKSKKLFALFLVAAVLLNLIFFSVSGTFKSRMLSMFNPKIYRLELRHHSDIESHIALIESAWAVFKRFPLTGVGVGGFSKYFDDHKDVRFPWYSNAKTGKKMYDLYDDWPENGYMQVLAETGIFGFIALMWLFVLGLKIPYKFFKESGDPFKKRVSAAAIGCSIVFYGSFAGVSNMSNDQLANLWLFFLAAFAGAVSAER